MEDPKYSYLATVGGNKSSYRIDAFPDGTNEGLQEGQSFILSTQFQDEQTTPDAFDISGATATLYVSAFNVSGYTPVLLVSGVLSDSGSGTTDTVTFTVPKDTIPGDLGNFPTGYDGNAVFYFILEDADTKLQFSQVVNVYDEDYALTGSNSPSSSVILVAKNDFGTVIDTALTTPPVSPSINDSYIIAVGGTGDWAGEDGSLAVYNGSAWIFKLPFEGAFVFDATLNAQKVNDGSLWNVRTVAAGSVTNSQLADMIEDTIKGRPTGSGTGSPQDITYATLKSDLSLNLVDNTSDANKPVSTAQQTALDLKLTATAQAADTAKLSTKDVDLTGITNNYVIKYQSSGDKFIVAAEAAAGSGINALPYTFSTDITATDPTGGGVKFDNATMASVANIYISDTDADSKDLNIIIGLLGSGDTILIKEDATKFLLFNITSVTDNTGWFTIAGSVQTAGALLTNSGTTVMEPYYSASGSGGGLVSFAGRTTAAVTPAASDYDASLIDNDSGVTGTFVSDALDQLDTDKTDSSDVNTLIAASDKIDATEAAAGTDNNQTGTAYTLVLTDEENKTIWMNNAAANTVTIPTNASVAFPVGTKINVTMEDAGVTTIEGDTGVTVNGASGGSVVINNQFQGATLSKRSTDTWIITGDIT